jgi:hypothetical protein
VEAKTPYGDIADLVSKKFHRKISKGTITKLCGKYIEEGNLNDLPRSG